MHVLRTLPYPLLTTYMYMYMYMYMYTYMYVSMVFYYFVCTRIAAIAAIAAIASYRIAAIL